MILSVIIGAIGTGLLSTIDLTTTTVRWAAYMVMTGVGIGVGVQLPYTAVQVVLRYLAQPVIDHSSVLTCMPAKQMRRLLMVGLFYFSGSLGLIGLFQTAIVVFFSQLGG